MATSTDFLATLVDLLLPLGEITTRRLFGGAAIYSRGQVFALVLDDVLYLKSDEANAGDFEAEGCAQFTYDTKDGLRVLTSYRRAPDRLLDEPDDLVEWARTALAAGRRARSRPMSRRKGMRRTITSPS